MNGVVTKVTDGDTVWIQPSTPNVKRIKLRIEGIDAPERCQPWGRQATQALSARVMGQRVSVPDTGRRSQDVYGRALGPLLLQGEDVGAWMVRQGHAWSYRPNGRKGRYDTLEAQASAARRGLFSERDPMQPYLFRRVHGGCKSTAH